MICTIGSLVQGTANRCRWFAATTIYIIACSLTSVLLGILLSSSGQVLLYRTCITSVCISPSGTGLLLTGLIALVYALSDIGMFQLPRPRLMHAVPVTWWRWWKPYGAALAYGAALGVGVTTHIQFGAFYVLCLWCVVKGDIFYGAVLMGSYGIARSLTLLPASWGIYHSCSDSSRGFERLLASLGTAKLIMATILVLFGAQVLGSLLFS